MHDPSLKRTMGVDRLVADTPRAELPKDVPTFEEAIACFHELGLGCNVEIKPCPGREVETAEIHLATGFQNLLFDHPAFPEDLRQAMHQWCFEHAADERTPDQTEQQFVYSSRKNTIGPFKRELWDLPTKEAILVDQRAKIDFLFRELGVDGGRATVEHYIHPVPVHRPLPASLRASVAAG